MSILRFKVVIVLHRKEIIESKTCTSIVAALENAKYCHEIVPYNIELTIWNNGPSSINSEFKYNDQINKYFKFNIIQHNNNLALSKVYNTIVNNSAINYDYLVILDDDSLIPSNFFIEIYNSDKVYGSLFKIPIVEQNGFIISPIRANHKKLSFIGPGFLSGRDNSIIGSGMVIPFSFLKYNRFDENLSFYGVDHDIAQCYLRHSVINIMPVFMTHSLSTDFTKNVKFPKFKVDSLLFSTLYNGKKHDKKLSSIIRALKYTIRFAFRCKRPDYILLFFHNIYSTYINPCR